MKIREYLTDEKFLQTVKFTGETSEDDMHYHNYKVNQKGDGKTGDTKFQKKGPDHVHDIKNWKIRRASGFASNHSHKIDAKKAKLSEAIVIGLGDIAGDDDAPTGNILMGRKYKKVTVSGVGGTYQMSVPVDDWHWGEWEYAKGMEVKDNYHETLDHDSPSKDRMWKYISMTGTPNDPMGLDREDMIAGTEESMPDYVANVVKHEEHRDLQKKNLPDVVFQISKMLGQEAETEDPSVED